MKSISSFFLFGIFCLLVIPANAQRVHDSLLAVPSPNFFQIREVLNPMFSDTLKRSEGFLAEDGEEAHYKRWEYFWERRIYPDGSFPSPYITINEWNNYVSTHGSAMAKFYKKSGNWSPIGPIAKNTSEDGIGRITAITFHPKDTNIIFAGTPNGGLWKTTNNGNTWTTGSDNLPVIGLADIVIHPDTPDIMYIATGDKAGYHPSMGILKSTNGGVTWDTTGFNWLVKDKKFVRKLAMNIFHPNIILAATTEGIYRTADDGTTWTKVAGGPFIDIVYKPGSDSIAYASNKRTLSTDDVQIWKTTNDGLTWKKVTSFSNAGRIQLAVTPANPDMVKAIVSLTNSLFGGIYSSSNSGSSFDLIYSNTILNLIGSASDGKDFTVGIGWYALSIGISPYDSNLVYAGGINSYKSTDGGKTWAIATVWSNYNNPDEIQVVHGDKHVYAFHPFTGHLWEGNDGGVYRRIGNEPYSSKCGNMQIGQFYSLASCDVDPTIIVGGLQDNGSSFSADGIWKKASGGDGLKAISDPRDNQTFYTSSQNGIIYMTTDQFQFMNRITNFMPNGQEKGAWLTPYVLDPVNPDNLYAGYKCVYFVTDNGWTWIPISGNITTSYLTYLAVAPSDSKTIYTGDGYGVTASFNQGNTWSKVFSTSNYISSLVVSPINPKKIYITYSGYIDHKKVAYSEDGGKTWTDISGTLPNVPALCIGIDKYSHDLYLGTDVGVFYRDTLMNDWQLFNTGLPNTSVNDISFHYKTAKVRAGTYGRGAWESDMVKNPKVGLEKVIRENKNLDITIHPNPSNGTFILKSNLIQSKVKANVYNYMGQLLKTIELVGPENEICLNELSDGVYYIGLANGNGYKLTPLVISK